MKKLLLLPLLGFVFVIATNTLFAQNNETVKAPLKIELNAEKLNNPEEVAIEYIWGLLDATKQGSPMHREEIIKRSLEGNILAMSFLHEIPGIYKDPRIFETLMQQIQIPGLKNNRYYSYAVNILSALKDLDISDKERAKKLAEFKSNYKKSFRYMSFSANEVSPYIQAIVDRSIDIIWSDTSAVSRDQLNKKYKRYPQKFEIYLTVPEIVNIHLESFRLIHGNDLYRNNKQLQIDYDLPFHISASMAEGYILNARYFVRGTEMFNHMNYPMGLDRFGNTQHELKTKGYLNNDFDGFIYADSTFTYEGADADYKMGEFKTQEDLLQAFAALFFEDRDAFFRDLSKYNYKPEILNRDQRRVGSILRMVSGFTGDDIKKYGANLTGHGKRHGDGLYNAQWAPATAEYLEQMYGDIFEAFYLGNKIDVNELETKFSNSTDFKRIEPKMFNE